MSLSKNNILIFALVITLFAVSLKSFATGKSFSAEAIQSAPGMQSNKMNLFVSADNSVRIEMLTPQGKIVQQYIASTGIMRVLYPDRKEYLEQVSKTPLTMPGTPAQDPCDNLPGAACEKLGEEVVNGELATHWSMVRSGPNNQKFKIEQWIDKKRGITLREVLPNGVSINANMAGKEAINGRGSERWEVIMKTADGKVQSGTRWYDAELGITIKEEFPNGSVRELRNIKLGEPDANLFLLPKDYRKLDVPAQPQRKQ